MQLLQELQNRGFKISVVNGDTLKVIPGSKLTADLTERLKTEKPRLIKILTRNRVPEDCEKVSKISRLQIQLDAYLDAAIERLNEFYRFHRLANIPPQNERLSRLENEITRCFLSEDVTAFKLSVDQWERYFMFKRNDT